MAFDAFFDVIRSKYSWSGMTTGGLDYILGSINMIVSNLKMISIDKCEFESKHSRKEVCDWPCSSDWCVRFIRICAQTWDTTNIGPAPLDIVVAVW